jgi:hypothetical protein
MTGRYAIRTGATQAARHHVMGSDDRGIVPSIGDASGLFGKS